MIARGSGASGQHLSRAILARTSPYYSVPLQKGETDTLQPQGVLALMLAAGFILLMPARNLRRVDSGPDAAPHR